MRSVLLSLLVAATAVAQPSTLAPGGLEAVPPPGAAVSSVSARGDAVAGLAADATAPFAWSAAFGSHAVALPDSLAVTAASAHLTSDGQTLVGHLVARADAGTHSRAYRWTSADGLAWLPAPSRFEARAHAASANGSFAIGEIWSEAVPDPQAVLWTRDGRRIRLGALAGDDRSRARDVSADGTVVVGTSYGDATRRAVRWTPEAGLVALEDLPFAQSEAYAVSADGRTVVGYAYDTSVEDAVAFLWREGEAAQVLGRWFPRDVSADGETVVGDARGGAVVWTRYAGLRRVRDVVDAEGWWLSGAVGVSADGTVVVGGGDAPDGTPASWRAWLPAPRR